MNPLLKYTLGRIGLFLAAFLIVYPVPQLSLPVKLLAALIASFVLSWFLLRRWRDEMSVHLADKLAQRRAEKARLRAALSGEDNPGPDSAPDSAPGSAPDSAPGSAPDSTSDSASDSGGR